MNTSTRRLATLAAVTALLLLLAISLTPSPSSAHSIEEDPTIMKPTRGASHEHLTNANEPGTPPHKHTQPSGSAADESGRRGPLFSQRLSPRAAYHSALRRLHDAQQHLLALNPWRRTPHVDPFAALLDPFDRDLFRGFGPRAAAQPHRRSALSSLWNDPLLDWPDVHEWPSDYFAHHEQAPMLAGEEAPAAAGGGAAGAVAARRGDAMGSMLASTFDVSEDADKYIVRASVPGWTPEEVRVEVQGDTLILSGERSVHKKIGEEGGAEKAKEGEAQGEVKQYAYFRKVYTLPQDVKTDELRASFDAGTHALRVEVPKPHAAIEPPPKPAKVTVPLQVKASADTHAPAKNA